MDFLSFKRFISIEVLIFFYYSGAVILPVLLWYLSKWLMRKYQLADEAGKLLQATASKVLWPSLNKNQKIQLTALFVTMFLLMELFWRMLFEFLIAYIQIRDALLGV